MDRSKKKKVTYNFFLDQDCFKLVKINFVKILTNDIVPILIKYEYTVY